MAEDRFERVTNLVTFLLSREQGATFTEILEQIPGWPDGVDARRRAFERDKRVLRDEGIPLVEENGRYRIPPEQYYLPELELSDVEAVALRLAVAAVPLGGESTGLALHKLTLGAGSADAFGIEEAVVSLGDSSDELLPLLHRAVRERSPVLFDFRGERRVVEPLLLFFRNGNWYLTGHDRAREDTRSFRLDRVSSVEVGEPGGFERGNVPRSEDVFPREPWLVGGDVDAAVKAVVDVDAVLAAKATAEVGGRAVVEAVENGGVRLTMEVTNSENFRSWVLGMLDHAVVVSPASLRDEIVASLEAMT